MTSSRLEALLLDFDGTLVNTMPALWGCYEAFLAEYGIKATREGFAELTGPALPEIVRRLQRKYDLSEPLEILMQKYYAFFREAYAADCAFFPDVLSVLHSAKKQQIRLAIVTSAPLRLIGPFLERHAPVDFFDLLITHDDNYPSKPSPEPYLRALQALNVHANDALAVEDSRNGVMSAHAARLAVIQFAENCDVITPHPGACHLVHSWKELRQILDLQE